MTDAQSVKRKATKKRQTAGGAGIPVPTVRVGGSSSSGAEHSSHRPHADTALLTESGGRQIIEICSTSRFAAKAGGLGLRPGFAVDLCENKPYGPQEGDLGISAIPAT